MEPNKVITIPTGSDTQLSLQVVKTTTEDAASSSVSYEVGLMLYTETGAEGDGEQITLLSSGNLSELIQQLSSLKDEIDSLNGQGK